MLDIQDFKKIIKLESLALTKHSKNRLIERNISVDDIINAINTGIIIKQYENDKPLPSCLVLGRTINDKLIHIVISHDEEFVYLITAYYPDPNTWSDNYTIRKEH